ncbi:cupin domain-containing protein [Nocardioides dongxiaopingii]|uniref:cupin domain-containing protein n=1 Tax=Nocardioides dongxiaopingii TaxID=2576036 RepID=UPI0010C76B77|nr:cupin domain-containing protein [Nocardioides dongxiaopingii]
MPAPATLADARLLSPDALTAPLAGDPDGTAAGGADGGPMPTASATLTAGEDGTGSWEIGLWEAAPGTDVDVEADELFVVLAGRGTVRFDDGSELALRPGVVVRLRAGDRTTWTVTEALRKLYVLLPAG